jgi:hypothetical protein
MVRFLNLTGFGSDIVRKYLSGDARNVCYPATGLFPSGRRSGLAWIYLRAIPHSPGCRSYGQTPACISFVNLLNGLLRQRRASELDVVLLKKGLFYGGVSHL